MRRVHDAMQCILQTVPTRTSVQRSDSAGQGCQCIGVCVFERRIVVNVLAKILNPVVDGLDEAEFDRLQRMKVLVPVKY